MKKSTFEDFYNKAIAKFGKVFTYRFTDYNGVDTPIEIYCPTHGNFTQTPYKHLKSTKGCPKCSRKAAALNKTCSTKDFIAKAKKIHGNKYDYSSTVYTAAKEKLTIICPDHGTFEQLASGHLSGYGCKHCSSNGKGRVDMDKPCTFYYLHLPDLDLYKIGITTLTVEHRYRTSFDREQFTVLFTKLFSTGREAYEYEQSLIAQYNKYKYIGEKVLKTGNTELFTTNILKDNNE